MKKKKVAVNSKQRIELIPKKLQHEFAMFFARRGIQHTSIALRSILVGYLVHTDQDEWAENGVEIVRALLKLMDKVQGMLPERSTQEAGDISDLGKYYPERHEDDFDDGYEG